MAEDHKSGGGGGEKEWVVYAAIVGNLGIAISKFFAAAFTGSSSMLAEGIHSSVDTANDCLLILGLRRSKRPPDENHPFGHGKELYFWTLLVAVFIFGVGGGMGMYEGITHLLHPKKLENPTWNYVVLGIAAVLEGTTWGIALKNFLKQKPAKVGIFQAVHLSKDPTVFSVLFEDSAALLGLGLAFLGIFLGHLLDNPYLDGVASIGIGVVLTLVAGWLAWESKGLLVGESAKADEVEAIRQVIDADPDVGAARPPMTMHLGPEQILVNLDVNFRDGLDADGIEAAVRRLESAIREKVPRANRIYIEANALKSK